MHFDFWTFAFQAVNFAVLAYLLKRFLYKPVTAVLARRREEASRLSADAKAARAEADGARLALEAERAVLEQERQAVLQATREQAEQEQTAVLAQARQSADALAQGVRERLAEERLEAESQLQRRATDLSLRVAARLLAEASAPDLSEAFLERLAAYLSQLDPPRAEALRAELATGHPPRLITATPLAPEQRERWQKRLGAYLGREPLEFDAEGSLLAGVELQLPKTSIRFSWRDALDDFGKELSGGHAR